MWGMVAASQPRSHGSSLLWRVLTIRWTGFPVSSLLFVVDTKIAVLAETLGVECSIIMITLSWLSSSTLSVITLLTHAVSIVWFRGVRAFRDYFPMLLVRLLFLLIFGKICTYLDLIIWIISAQRSLLVRNLRG